MKKAKNYSYIDLFCGCGGLSLGFDGAGFKNIFSVEINKIFAETYKKNFPNHKIIVDDIKNISNQEIKRMVKNIQIDVIVGGCPCQGFSIAGNIARNVIDDPRNSLFKEFVRFVTVIKPKVFVFENVANLKKYKNGKMVDKIIKAFEKCGYNVKTDVLLASDYGVPQDRRRLFIVGMLGTNNFEFPQKSKSKISIKQAISDLPKLESGEKSNIPNHIAMRHTKQMLEKMKYVKDGGNRKDIPKKIRPTTGDIRKYVRYDSNKPSYCVTGDMRKIFHYEQNRALTCRELARLQTFPDTFVFEGNSSEVQQQIGNAVPVLLAKKIALKIKKALNGK